jgi:hypothetical protein
MPMMEAMGKKKPRRRISQDHTPEFKAKIVELWGLSDEWLCR